MLETAAIVLTALPMSNPTGSVFEVYPSTVAAMMPVKPKSRPDVTLVKTSLSTNFTSSHRAQVSPKPWMKFRP